MLGMGKNKTFEKLKAESQSGRVLAYYDLKRETIAFAMVHAVMGQLSDIGQRLELIRSEQL